MTGIYVKLNNLKIHNILDLATGQGVFLEEICNQLGDYKSAIGVDTSDKALEAGNKKEMDERIKLEKMDCSDLQFDDETFDLVTICNSIHHLENREKVLFEALRVLKKDGLFIVSEMFHSPSERPSQSTHSHFHHWWGEIDSALGNYHGKTFTKDELLEIVENLPLSSFDFEQIDGEDEDIFSEEIKNHIQGAFRMYKERASKLESPQPFIKRGEELLEKLKIDGFAPASRLEIIGMK